MALSPEEHLNHASLLASLQIVLPDIKKAKWHPISIKLLKPSKGSLREEELEHDFSVNAGCFWFKKVS
jgi:hypothetical protein